MMKRKSIKKKRYGKCPRVACKGTALLPVGTTHIPNRHCAKLFCPRCADIYQPPEDRRIDGAYFGTEFPAVFLLSYPEYDMRDHFHVFEFQKFGFKIRDPLLTNGPHSKNDYRKNEDE
ncbi:Casein kinase II regulatory subunit family protein [Histomonas meleagridis]|nr:Casein kinase II regulatory subunit family protein [Histomonas meleagridis]